MAFQRATRRERLLEAATGYLMLQMPEHALRELAKLDRDDACGFDYHRLMGEAHQQGEHFGAALAAFDRALAERPDDLSVLLNMAWCYKRVNRLEDAIGSMEEARRCHPEEAIVLYNLSCYYALAGERAQAFGWLGCAIRKQGDLRKLAARDSDFQAYWDDPNFKFITGHVDNAPRCPESL